VKTKTPTERVNMSQATQYTVPTGAWSADKIHSTVGFAVPLMAGSFQGTFSDFDARLNEGALLGTAEVASVEVKDPNLGGQLQSPDFFDAERFPQLAFEADEIRRSGDELTITGELTLKGHTEPVEIRGHINDPAPDPYAASASGCSSRPRSTGPISGSPGTGRSRAASRRWQTRSRSSSTCSW
jgi:polyisoprenoid-binding protein YceI